MVVKNVRHYCQVTWLASFLFVSFLVMPMMWGYCRAARVRGLFAQKVLVLQDLEDGPRVRHEDDGSNAYELKHCAQEQAVSEECVHHVFLNFHILLLLSSSFEI